MTHPYGALAYAASLGHIGAPVEVPEWGCCVLERALEDGLTDAAGPYPLAPLPPDCDLAGGLGRLRSRGFVSVVLVLDDVHRPELARLERSFDHVRAFKTHFVHRPELGAPTYGKHHRYEIRRALRSVEAGPLDLARDEKAWSALYSTLSARHGLAGLHAFPPKHVWALAAMKGFEAFGAWAQGELVSAHIWAVHEGCAHSHLAASSARGYELGAAYAVNAAALERFVGARFVNLGGGAGASVGADDGLARFKRGFANSEASAYICGAVLRPEVYRHLCGAAGREGAGFFPAYRTS